MRATVTSMRLISSPFEYPRESVGQMSATRGLQRYEVDAPRLPTPWRRWHLSWPNDGEPPVSFFGGRMGIGVGCLLGRRLCYRPVRLVHRPPVFVASLLSLRFHG